MALKIRCSLLMVIGAVDDSGHPERVARYSKLVAGTVNWLGMSVTLIFLLGQGMIDTMFLKVL